MKLSDRVTFLLGQISRAEDESIRERIYSELTSLLGGSDVVNAVSSAIVLKPEIDVVRPLIEMVYAIGFCGGAQHVVETGDRAVVQ